MPLALDLTGQTFGRWTVLSVADHPKRKKYFLCRCQCGAERAVRIDGLTSGKNQSCGCLRNERVRQTMTKHGDCQRAEYRVWQSAKERCHNPKNPHYKNYGGRGIVMSPEWRSDYVAFIRDMGPRPTPKHTVERRLNDGPYSKDNCYWATRAEQTRNMRSNVWLMVNGERILLNDAAKRYGINLGTLRQRLRMGWSEQRAVTTPPLWTR